MVKAAGPAARPAASSPATTIVVRRPAEIDACAEIQNPTNPGMVWLCPMAVPKLGEKGLRVGLRAVTALALRRSRVADRREMLRLIAVRAPSVQVV